MKSSVDFKVLLIDISITKNFRICMYEFVCKGCV